MSEHICYVYSAQYEPPPIRLMAWVRLAPFENCKRMYILHASAHDRKATVYSPRHGTHEVTYSQLEHVAMYEGGKVLENFGRPPLAEQPAWADFGRFAEVV